MEGNFLGLGLKNIFGLFLLFMVLIVVMKVVLTKHPVPGVSEVVQAV